MLMVLLIHYNHTLQEILTVKSDDVLGRVKVYESIIKGQEINQAGVPESFRVLMKEFQALGLDVSIVNDEGETLQLKEIEDAENKEESSTFEEIDSPPITITEEDDSTEEDEFDDEDDFVDDEDSSDDYITEDEFYDEEGADF